MLGDWDFVEFHVNAPAQFWECNAIIDGDTVFMNEKSNYVAMPCSG